MAKSPAQCGFNVRVKMPFGQRFIETAEKMEAETDRLQADIATQTEELATVTARVNPDLSTNDFSASGTVDLSNYLRTTDTSYFYCWDDSGLVTQQDTAAAACP